MAALRARRESPSGVREEDSGKVMIVITSITLRKKGSRTSIFFFLLFWQQGVAESEFGVKRRRRRRRMDVVAVVVDLKFEFGEWKCLSRWYWKVETGMRCRATWLCAV